jgi:hypothetical protein
MIEIPILIDGASAIAVVYLYLWRLHTLRPLHSSLDRTPTSHSSHLTTHSAPTADMATGLRAKRLSEIVKHPVTVIIELAKLRLQ